MARRAAPGRHGTYDPGERRQRRVRFRRGLAPRRLERCAVRGEQHRPAAQPGGQLAQHRGHRVGAGSGRRQALLGLRDPAQLVVAGLGHQPPHRARHRCEGSPGGHLHQWQAMAVAGCCQGLRHRVVHRREPEAERGAARRDDPRRVPVGVLRELHPGGQQQLSAEQIRIGVGHLARVHPVHRRSSGLPGRRARDLAQPEIPAGEQGGERDGGGRWSSGIRHGCSIHRRRVSVDGTYTSTSLSGHLGSTFESSRAQVAEVEERQGAWQSTTQ